MLDVIGPRVGLVAGDMADDAHLHFERRVGEQRARAAEDVGRLDAELAADFQPALPADEHGERGDAAEVLEDVVQADFIHAAGREIELGDVGEDIGLHVHHMVRGGRVINVHIAGEVLFAAAEVQAQRRAGAPDTALLQLLERPGRGGGGGRAGSAFCGRGEAVGRGVDVAPEALHFQRGELVEKLAGVEPRREFAVLVFAEADVEAGEAEAFKVLDAAAGIGEELDGELEGEARQPAREAGEDGQFEALDIDLAVTRHAVLAEQFVERGDWHVDDAVPVVIGEAALFPFLGEGRDRVGGGADRELAGAGFFGEALFHDDDVGIAREFAAQLRGAIGLRLDAHDARAGGQEALGFRAEIRADVEHEVARLQQAERELGRRRGRGRRRGGRAAGGERAVRVAQGVSGGGVVGRHRQRG